MEVNNLLSKEIEELGSKIQEVETNTIEVGNLIKLLSRSLENSEDSSIKLVLDMASKKIDNLVNDNIIGTYKNIDSLMKMAVDLEAKPTRQRRPREVNADAPKRTRKPRAPKQTEDIKDNAENIKDNAKDIKVNAPNKEVTVNNKEHTKDEANKTNKEDTKA